MRGNIDQIKVLCSKNSRFGVIYKQRCILITNRTKIIPLILQMHEMLLYVSFTNTVALFI